MSVTAAPDTDRGKLLRFRVECAEREREKYEKKCRLLREEQDIIDRQIVYADGNLERSEAALEKARKELDDYLADESNGEGSE